MKNQSQVTLAITAFNESQRGDFDWIHECIAPAIHHPLVREIVVVNDGTPDFGELVQNLSGIPKVRLFHNPVNLGVFGNKVTSVERSTSEWVLMCDSDNVMGEDYYDRLVDIGLWDSDAIYATSFARPNFDYRSYIGEMSLEKFGDLQANGANIRKLQDRYMFWCLANTGNQFVHRSAFLDALDGIPRERFDLWQPNYFGVSQGGRPDMHWRMAYDAQDSFFINRMWLMAGGSIQIVDGLEYSHRVDKAAPGNYDRSPADKEALAPLYFLELMETSKTGKCHRYQFDRRDRGHVFLYKDLDVPGRMVAVNMDISIPFFEFCDKG